MEMKVTQVTPTRWKYEFIEEEVVEKQQVDNAEERMRNIIRARSKAAQNRLMRE